MQHSVFSPCFKAGRDGLNPVGRPKIGESSAAGLPPSPEPPLIPKGAFASFSQSGNMGDQGEPPVIEVHNPPHRQGGDHGARAKPLEPVEKEQGQDENSSEAAEAAPQ